MRSLYRPLVLLCLLMATTGMAPRMPEPENSTTEPLPYLERFKTLAKTYGATFGNKSVTFSFGALFGGAVGVCYMNGSGRNSITFSSSAWNRGSDTFKEMLVFHELGHCLLGRGHKNTNHSDGRRESLMASMMFDQRIYLAFRDEYLKELFTANSRQVARTAVGLEDFGPCRFGQ